MHIRTTKTENINKQRELHSVYFNVFALSESMTSVSTHMNQFLVTLSSFIGHTGQVGVSFLTVFAHDTTVVVGVLPQEALGVVVAVDVDLGQGIVGSRLLTTFMNTSLQPRQQQLQSEDRQMVWITQHKV